MSVRNWIHKFNNKSIKFGSDIDQASYKLELENNNVNCKLIGKGTLQHADRLKILCDLQNHLDNLQLTATIDELVENMPRLVLVGSQSVGKTSILEYIIGHPNVLLKGKGMVTRQPVLLKLYHDISIDFLAIISDTTVPPTLEQVKNKNYDIDKYTICQSSASLAQCIQAKSFHSDWLTSEPLYINIYSAKSPNLCLVDLPGLISVPDANQPENLDIQIKKLILEYIEQPSSIIIAVSPANQDIATSESLRLAREVDKLGERTIGVVSKFDLVGDDNIIFKVLNGELYKLYYGYVPVVIDQQNEEKTISYINVLKKKLECTLFDKMYDMLLVLKTKLQEKYNSVTRELNQLVQLDSLFYNSLQRDHLGNQKRQVDCTDASESTALYNFVTALNNYISFYEDVLNGRAMISQTTLIGGSVLIELFNKEFKNELYSIDPISDISPEALEIAIKNCCGNRTYIFIPEKVFDIIIKQKIELLIPIIENCILKAMNTLLTMNEKVVEIVPLFQLFYNLKQAVINQVNDYCRNNADQALKFCQNLINIELTFINKHHPDFTQLFHRYNCQSATTLSPTSQPSTKISSELSQINSAKKDTLYGPMLNDNSLSTLWKQLINNKGDTANLGDISIRYAFEHYMVSEDDNNTKVIKLFVSTYFEIVRKTIYDTVQKSIMHFLVHQTHKNIKNNLIINLQAQLPNLMKPDPIPLLRKEKLNQQKS